MAHLPAFPSGFAAVVSGPVLAVCMVVAFCLPGFCIALWVMACGYRRHSEREFSRLRQIIDSDRTSCAEDFAGLSRRFEALERGRQSTDELLHGGRLSQSQRAQALQLLRTGVAPDTAAVTLGVATREMRLLAKVSRLLTAP
ncbi:MAG: hypothetical protein ABUS51_10740 [Acidobacteriota bacterium]